MGVNRLVVINPNLRVFMTTKMTRANWTPELTSHTAVVNVTVREQGFEEQMLGVVVRQERRDVQGRARGEGTIGQRNAYWQSNIASH